MRLIDADTLLEKVEKIQPWDAYLGKYAQGIRHCMELVSLLIQDAPTIEPERQWIPCKDGEPEEYGEYRITWTTSVSKKRFIGDAEYEVSGEWNAKQDRFKGEWILDDYIKNYPDVKVIAWKPLEEPYREEGGE